MKIKIVTKDGNEIDLESSTYPIFEGGFIRLVTEGTYMDCKKARWINTDNIGGIELIND